LKNRKFFLARGSDLSEISVWLEGVQKLVQGEKKTTLSSKNTKLALSKFGRGGTLLSVKTGPKNAAVFFSLAEFALQLRSAAKDFTKNVLGRVSLLIKQDSKTLKKDDAEAHLEFEKAVELAIKPKAITTAASNIKHTLEHGAFPQYQKQLEKQKQQKKQIRALVEVENGNVLDFVYANLPPNFPEVRSQAQRQAEEAVLFREQQKVQSEAERERKRQEKKVARAAETAAKADARKKKDSESGSSEPEEKHQRTKTRAIKTVEDDGFVTVDTKYTHVDEKGYEIETVIASEKKKEEEKEEGNEKKKKKAGAPATSTSPVLQNNPFAPVKQASGIQSAQEIQAKLNAKKGEQRNIENNEQQKEKKNQLLLFQFQLLLQKRKRTKRKKSSENLLRKKVPKFPPRLPTLRRLPQIHNRTSWPHLQLLLWLLVTCSF